MGDKGGGEDEEDHRMEFLMNYLAKAIRIKPDKWNKMIAVDENKKVLLEFLNTGDIPMLIFRTSNAGLLVPTYDFQPTKSKLSYFIKRKKEAVTLANFYDVIIFGDVSCRPIEELTVLASDVFMPLLMNPLNTANWPVVVYNDVSKQLAAFNNVLYQLKGALKGVTLLPMPPDILHIYNLEDRAIEGELNDDDLALKASAENAVIKWANIIETVLKQTSQVAFAGGANPGPMREVEFWESRLKNLEGIYDQLRDPRVKKLVLFLELLESSYMKCFKDTFKSVVAGIIEARDICLYFKPMIKHFSRFEDNDFLTCGEFVRPLMHCVGLLWANSRYYCASNRIVTLFKEIANLLIDAVNKEVDPSSIFQGDIEEVYIKIGKCISLLSAIEDTFEMVRTNLSAYFPEGTEPVPWTFHPKTVFARLHQFKKRLELVYNLLGVALEFFKLEKVEIGGLKGRIISQKAVAIFAEFNTAFNYFRQVQYEILELEDMHIVVDNEKFLKACEDFDNRLAAIFTQAFEECFNLDACFKLLNVIASLGERKIIADALYPKFEYIISLFHTELDIIKALYDDGILNGIPIDKNLPPVSGKLWWLHKLYIRLTSQGEGVLNIEHSVMEEDPAKCAVLKYRMMVEIISTEHRNTFMQWAKTIPGIIKMNLAKTQLKRLPNDLLAMNFDEQLACVLRDVKYIKFMDIEGMPCEAVELFDRSEELVNSIQNLSRTVEWYNHVKLNTTDEEYNIITSEIEVIDEILEKAVTTLTWETDNFEELNLMHLKVNALYMRVNRAQGNISTFLYDMEAWSTQSMFIRGKIVDDEIVECEDSLLFLADRTKRVATRYKNISMASAKMAKILKENFYLYYNVPVPTSTENDYDEEEEFYGDDEDEEEQISPKEKDKHKGEKKHEGGKKHEGEKKHKGEKKHEGKDKVEVGGQDEEEDGMGGLSMVDPYLMAWTDERWIAYLNYIDDIVSRTIIDMTNTSLDFFHHETDKMVVRYPFCEIVVELHDQMIVGMPSLDIEQENNFTDFMMSFIVEIQNMSQHMQRVIQGKDETYYEDTKEDNSAVGMRGDVALRVNQALEECVKFFEETEEYEYLWLDDRAAVLSQFLIYGKILTQDEVLLIKDKAPEAELIKEQAPTTVEFRTQINAYQDLYKKAETIEEEKIFFRWLRMDIRPFRQSILNYICKWSNMFKQYLIDTVLNSISELEAFMLEANALMLAPLDESDFQGLINVMEMLSKVKDRQYATDNMFDPLKAIIELLKEYDMQFTEETLVQLQELPEKWLNCKKIALQTKQAIAPLQAKQVDAIKKRLALFDIRQALYKENFMKLDIFLFNCKDIYNKLDRINRTLLEMEDTMALLTDQGNLFELQIPEYKQVKSVRKDVKQVKQLWDYVNIINSWIGEWKYTLWKKIDVEGMEMDCKKFAKDLRAMDKEMRAWDVYMQMEAALKNMLTSLRAITELQNPAIRERHWIELMQATKVKFVMDESTTLNDLLALKLHEFEDEVKNIVDKSVKEMAMEKIIKELNSTWNTMEFGTEMHERTKFKLLRASEEMIETLEDHQVQLQNMMTSKFIGFFLEEVSDWQKKLSNADSVISSYFEVQRKWCYLESIFIGSEDIRNQLPEDSKRFDRIDRDFKDMLAEILKAPNVVKSTNKPGLSDRLDVLTAQLLLCEKALNDYLETKRLAFPRFYFVSSADLLDILSNGNQPDLVQRHLTKLFDSLGKLTFEKEGGKNSKHAIAMTSKENEEYVPFVAMCDCNGKVEIWLNRVIDIMRKTLHKLFSEAVTTYEFKAREVWIFDFPAQPALIGTQIWWTTEVNLAFAKLEEGYENSLKDYQKKQINQLYNLILLLLGDLTSGDRQKIMTVCTIDVHSRDVVAQMIRVKVENSQAFQWQSQLRHRWDVKLKDCFANICDAQFRYQYEYLGNTPRLVITPLTDRCYITLTQSLHLILGGAPAGPAGTGKTETTKDLGKALGIMVYVFNCSEQMDFKSVGNIYKGLSQTGTWGCFDEFNRIAVEVLSVVAVQVKTIQDAIKDKKLRFFFLGEDIILLATVGIFITMNPGYAGRTELPENLKACFRPCAMVVPDFELICEIMLVAEGFQDARLLARKFITLYTLCRELLSKQDHYDWGLRAIKSVLVVAGSLKRGDRQRPEDQVLMRALRDFNIPKIITDDVPVFMGLIGDLFPALDVPRKRNPEFEKIIKQSASDLKLQPEDGFILKIVQLEELFAVRHSVFIIGFAGTGKSMVWKTLNKTYANQKRRPVFNDLNPKAVTNDELFGIINPSTREWKDGLFSVIMRDQANLTGDGPKWIVLDGDIDPMWIESMNTIMDDNKVLTLASNERIALTAQMRLLFEIANLRTATPATVSRAGILYINPQDLGWSPFVTSWIDTRTVQSERSGLMLLFDKYVPPCLDCVKTRVKKITPIVDIAHIGMLCHLLDCFLIPANVPVDCPKEWYEIYFVFCVIWAFGSSLFQDQIIDWRNEFSKWFVNEFKTVRFPSAGTVFHYYIEEETKALLPWSDLIQEFELDPDLPLQATLVNTAETTRVRFFMDNLMANKHPVMLVGAAGCGKTVLVQAKLESLSDNYAVTNVPFNFYTTSEMLQRILEKPLEKKAGRVFGPPGSKMMIYFIDDMNMPEVDKYFTVQPHTLLRQHLDYQHWYDRLKLSLKDIHNVQYVSCMNPTAGSFTIDPRLQRHFSVFALSFPALDALSTIYTSILSQHLANPLSKMHKNVQKLCDPIIAAALALHQKVATTFLPTAVKFHYIFNLRDLSSIFQGILFATGDAVTNQTNFIRLWMHESIRVYCDKLTDGRDIHLFGKTITEIVKKSFEELNEVEVMETPLIFCHFAEGIGDPKYLQIRQYDVLNKLLLDALSGYNDLVAAMNLVLFEDAMNHICRINRIMEAPRGNALLVGVGGSGKQSLTRLAAFISSLEVFQIQLKKGYSITDMKADIAQIYIKAGLKSISSTFLMTDAQVPEEQFLVVINDMLASGEIPELLGEEDVENIISAMATEVKGAGLQDTRENCWKFYIDRVRRLIKVVLSFSPVGSTLRVRARKFPALVNCTSIDWFHEWPQEALRNVSRRFLAEIESLPVQYVETVSEFMSFVHTVVNEISMVYLANEKRYNYTTPKTFLEQIALYGKLLDDKTQHIQTSIIRLENGLLKLAKTSEDADGLKDKLAVQEVELAEKNAAADQLIKTLSVENEKVAKEQAFASEEEEKVKVIETDVSEKAKICEADLLAAEPILKEAQDALNTLNKNNLTELKSFGSPPEAVVSVCAAVLVLFSTAGKIPKDRSWKSCKLIMGKVDQFLNDLTFYDKDNIHPDVVKQVQMYTNQPEFNPQNILSKSIAAAGLCSWVINIMKYYDIYLVVAPKRAALKDATDQLNSAQKKLQDLNEQLNLLEKQLGKLRSDFDQATDEKLKCQSEAEKTATSIDLANRLVNGLASEKVRWRQSVIDYQSSILSLPGDVLIVTAFISYVGCFTRKYRGQLINKYWLPYLDKLENPIPMSGNVDPLALLTDDATIATWNNEGLPSDRMSAENATILFYSARWPLMIDPQLQGIKWIKNRYGEDLTVIRLNMRNYLDTLERCISDGETCLLENIGEAIDAVLDPILGRVLIKKGKCMKIGDKEVDYDPRFKLIIQTKLANPHYKPEIQAQTTLINFTVTRDGLEDQLLAEVVKCERPDLEQLKSNLTKQQNDFKITLKTCEDNLLERLSSASGNILGDVSLVVNLETTKKTSAEISVKAAEAKITSVKIDEAREQYRPASARASLLYFILNDLNRINAIYQFSLKAFTVVFKYSLSEAEPAESLKDRVSSLLESITFCVFMYTTRGLFECDKLIFMAQMAFQILLHAEEISPTELDFLLRFPALANLTSPVDFLNNISWGGIKALANIDDFRGLDKDIEGSVKRWRKFVESECPENEKFPGEWKNKTALQKLCMMRAFRPDRMTYAIRLFIDEKLGNKYITARSVAFEKSYEETNNSTPTFFILSPGVNPLKDVEKLGKKLGFSIQRGTFHSVSLGQGQEIVAEHAMDIAAEHGHWVILQNIHLVARWLPTLEKKMEQHNENSNENYRLYLSAEASADPSSNVLPQGILESSIKITNEPPTGMFANLHKALDNFNQETLEMCSKEAEFKAILFSLCYFHAVVAERRKFGPQGWNRNYPFNVGDLTISVNVLYNYLENNTNVPWEDLRYLFGEIMYGGHITDDWDRRLCKFFLLEYMQPLLLEGELFYAHGFPAPPNTDYVGYHRFIDEMLPPESPYLYGLHPNAEIGFLTNISEIMFRTIFEMQPRDAGASSGGGMSREEKVRSLLDDIYDKLPEEFNIREMMSKVEDRTPYIIVCFQECDRMNMLTREMRLSLSELDLGLKGELTITPAMEALENALFMDTVPEGWVVKAYPSLLPLGQWVADLGNRIKELENWTGDFQMPLAVWLGGFFNPQSFLTAIMQQTARKNEWPLDKMCLLTDVTKKMYKEDFTAAPKEGANVCGLYMEGARWDSQTGSIGDAILKELFPVIPVIYIKAITQDKQDLKNMYDCPVYKTRMRGPTFVWTFNLKTKERAAKWVLGGVAMLLQI